MFSTLVPNEDRVREFDLGNGNKLFATRKDPYGHWFLSLERGALPEEFRGAYSSAYMMKQAVDRYVAIRKLVIEEIKDKPEKVEKKKNG